MKTRVLLLVLVVAAIFALIPATRPPDGLDHAKRNHIPEAVSPVNDMATPQLGLVVGDAKTVESKLTRVENLRKQIELAESESGITGKHQAFVEAYRVGVLARAREDYAAADEAFETALNAGEMIAAEMNIDYHDDAPMSGTNEARDIAPIAGAKSAANELIGTTDIDSRDTANAKSSPGESDNQPQSPESDETSRGTADSPDIFSLSDAIPPNDVIEEARNQLMSGLGPEFAESKAGRILASDELFELVPDMRRLLNELDSVLSEVVRKEFGELIPTVSETISLEAEDERGNVADVPVLVESRPLRNLSEKDNIAKTQRVFDNDEVAHLLQQKGAPALRTAHSLPFRRLYQGESGMRLLTEMRTLVGIKGGDWNKVESDSKSPIANAIAIRGLDFERGLSSNTTKKFDDSMFVSLEYPGGQVEVYQFRMTTESSSTATGVGRLDAKQVTYVRGLHKGRDPGYRLKGNVADGSRAGKAGTFKISGANIHSAYSQRSIDSDTPLNARVSLGCQVVAASKREFEKNVVERFDTAGVDSFFYTIVEEGEIRQVSEELQVRDKEFQLLEAHSTPIR